MKVIQLLWVLRPWTIKWSQLKNVVKTEWTVNTLIADEVKGLLPTPEDPPSPMDEIKTMFDRIRQDCIDVLFIDTTDSAPRLLAADKVESHHMLHWAKIKAIEVNSVIKTAVDHHVNVYYTHLPSEWFNNNHLWDRYLPVITLLFLAWKIWDDTTDNWPPPAAAKAAPHRPPEETLRRLHKTTDKLFLRLWIYKTLLFRRVLLFLQTLRPPPPPPPPPCWAI
jgi:hypothetical protein